MAASIISDSVTFPKKAFWKSSGIAAAFSVMGIVPGLATGKLATNSKGVHSMFCWATRMGWFSLLGT